MRKNIYNKQILMFNYYELISLTQYKEVYKPENSKVLNRLREYTNMLHDFKEMSNSSMLCDSYDKIENIGILLDDDIDLKMEKVCENIRTKIKIIYLNEIQNAFLCCVATQSDREIRDVIHYLFVNRLELTPSEVRNIFGEDVLEYILSHQNYDYVQELDPAIENDKRILLFQNGTLEETEVFCDKTLKL